MGGDEGLGRELGQHAHHELEDFFSLGWVGTRTKLVQDHHRPGREVFEQASNSHELHAQAPLGLIHLGFLNQRHHQARRKRHLTRTGRNEQAGLGHQLCEPERLQQARLAARVGARDQHDRVVAVRLDRAGDGRDSVSEQERIE